MRYKSLSVALLLIISTLNYTFAATNDISEKVLNLGVLNGQVQEGNTVKVNRTLPESIIYRLELGDKSPDTLVIRDATARAASNGAAMITVKNIIPGDQQNAYVTLNISMFVDSKKVPLSFSPRGEDVTLSVPPNGKIIELRVDAPAELQVPASYKGNIKVTMQIEDEYSNK
ncbi:DUF5462 family protein [Yersinia enterocolitica]|uniref:DUF5462 family protein n=1 Tax=Yersinia enterocolitica TaxID=630 RepID=UPI00398D0942